MKFEDMLEIAKNINEKVISESQALLNGCSDEEITTTLLMVVWSLQKSVEMYVDKNKVDNILKDFENRLHMERFE